MASELGQRQFSEWRAAAERGRSWLAAQLDAGAPLGDGPPDVNCLRKLVWVFAGHGDRVHAFRAADAVVERCFEHGRLKRPADEDWTGAAPYGLGWLICGAQMVNRYDLSRLCLAELEGFFDEKTGAAFSRPSADAQRPTEIDLGIQGAPLMANVATGSLERAAAAGRFLGRMLDEQPHLEERLYCFYDLENGFVTEFEERRRLAAVLERKLQCQPHANLGLSVCALAKLYEATGEVEFLDSARGYFEFQLRCAQDLFSHAQHHKCGWAGALLWRHTGEQKYLDAAIRIADNVAHAGLPDGRWVADIFFQRIEDQPLDYTVAMTCDATLWLRLIADELEAGLAGS